MDPGMNSIGVDIGGTFTDLVGYRDGALIISKTLTTPANPTVGVATALTLAGTRLEELDEFLHGTTIAINTVLERKGDKTALLTTQGFRDVYEIARGNRPDAFDIGFQRVKEVGSRTVPSLRVGVPLSLRCVYGFAASRHSKTNNNIA